MNNLAINNSIEIYQFVFHKQKIHISYFIISIKDLAAYLFKQKTDSCEIKILLTF